MKMLERIIQIIRENFFNETTTKMKIDVTNTKINSLARTGALIVVVLSLLGWVGEINGGSILVDSYYWDGVEQATTEMRDALVASGHTVSYNYSPITAGALAAFDVYVLFYPGVDHDLTMSGGDTIANWVEAGHGLWLGASFNNAHGVADNCNAISSRWGVTYNSDDYTGVVTNITYDHLVTDGSNPPTTRVNKFGIYAGCSLSLTSGLSLARYSGHTVMAAVEPGSGRAILIGDSLGYGPFDNTHLYDYDNLDLGLNTVGYLAEPQRPPVADADGPYTIYVGDTLTLDANDSTDDDNDIVSYMWDLDDDENFETDAGGEAVFDVNYTYLQSLGLLIDHTYNIHVKVTDSEGQSDVNDTTLIILPLRAIGVAVDIKPQSCPNPLNVKSKGVLPVAVLGLEDFDVTTIDPTSIRLAGVEPLRSGYEDVAAPFDNNDCNCVEDGPDGFLDLTLKFKTQKIVEAIGDVNDGDVRVLTLTGVLFDPMPFETLIEGADCILIRGRYKPINPADINKDGVVNTVDFAILAQNWLQSSIVDK